LAKAKSRQIENSKRLRYIRVLERFTQSITNYLFKADEISKEVFDKKVDNNLRYLERAEKVPLYKGEFSDLENLVDKILEYRAGDKEIESIKEDVLYTANQIEKSISRRQYKKDKHASDKFKDWEH
jgi:hypothetical protein